MTGLGEFTEAGDLPAEDEPDPPTIYAQGRILTHPPSGQRVAGYHGPVPERRCRGVRCIKAPQHRFHSLGYEGAFAISTDALELMSLYGVKVILIHEPDTHDVYEYRLEDFIEWGLPVPETHLDDARDPQRWVDRADPLHLWPGHGPNLNRGEPPEGVVMEP